MMKTFTDRHIGITPDSEASMLSELGYQSLDDLCNHAIAENIEYKLPKSANMTEAEFESHINNLGNKNTPTLSLIGQGFYPNYCPAIIRRNILENPSWYTQYTPYQAEISQGRLEALFNFQTVITELTGLPIANASLLDEGNACSEAIFMAYRYHREKRSVVLVCGSIDQHNVAVIKSRFKYLNITIQHGDISAADINENVCAILTKQFQQDGSLNTINSELFKIASQNGVIGILNSDLLALTLFQSAAELGAHICVGSVAIAHPNVGARLHSSRAMKNLRDWYQGESLVYPKISMAIQLIVWLFKHESNTYDEKRPPLTFVLHNHYLQ